MPQKVSLEELRRRVNKDPASIAFAQLAEEYRRAGLFDDTVRVARDGLTRHPGYLSARVTLGRALVELGDLDAAKTELDTVLKSAPENFAAIRALADIHQRRGDTPESAAAVDPEVLEPDAIEATIESAVESTVEADVEADVQPNREHDLELDVEIDVMLDLPQASAEAVRALDLDLHNFNTALEVLDALTLDLPPEEPDVTLRDEFDLASFRVDAAPTEPAGHGDRSLDAFGRPPTTGVMPDDRPPEGGSHTPADPSLGALEDWLSALVSDRAERRR